MLKGRVTLTPHEPSLVVVDAPSAWRRAWAGASACNGLRSTASARDPVSRYIIKPRSVPSLATALYAQLRPASMSRTYKDAEHYASLSSSNFRQNHFIFIENLSSHCCAVL
jgi:hypothetical protein